MYYRRALIFSKRLKKPTFFLNYYSYFIRKRLISIRYTKAQLLRISKGFTQQAVAELVGISQSYLSLIETYKAVPEDEIYTQITKLYDCHKSELYKPI